MPDVYSDLVIRIRAWEEKGAHYPVEAATDDGARFEGELRLDREALLALELNPPAYGQALFAALFAGGGDIRRAYDKASARADALNAGRLRVRLWIDDDAVELHALPWERLYHPSRAYAVPLTTSTQTPFSRYTSLETAEPTPVTEKPVKLLAAIANPLNLPGGLAPAKVDVEVESLRQALSEFDKTKQVQVTLMPGRTGLAPEQREQLEAEGWKIVEGHTSLDNLLRHLPGQHAFHFVGHGAFKRAGDHGPGQAALYLEKPDGAWQAVKDDDIVSRLAAVGELPHLIFLVACESAVRDPNAEHPFIGFGPKLVRAGVPAVVAMQDVVPVEMARQLSGEFYRRLIEHGEVDQALSQARLVIFNPKQVDWAIPVLFMRLKEGRLFAEAEKEREREKEKESGSINISVGGNANFGSFVGGNVVTTNTTNVFGGNAPATAGNLNLAELIKQFTQIKLKVGALPDKDEDEKEELSDTVKRIQDEVKKGEAAKADKVERWLKAIEDLSAEIAQSTASVLANPAIGASQAVRQVGEKLK
jgi:hypothetical protein